MHSIAQQKCCKYRNILQMLQDYPFPVLTCYIFIITLPIGKRVISVAFVRPSVCPSVAYIANNWRTQRLACPNLEGRFPTLEATCIPVSRSNGQSSELEAGGGIPCRPNPATTLLVLYSEITYN